MYPRILFLFFLSFFFLVIFLANSGPFAPTFETSYNRQFASTPSQPLQPPPPYPSLTLARSFGVFCARMHGTCTHTSTNALSLARVRKRTNTRQPDAKRDARASTRRYPLAKPWRASTHKSAASRPRSAYTGQIPRTPGPLMTSEGHGCWRGMRRGRHELLHMPSRRRMAPCCWSAVTTVGTVTLRKCGAPLTVAHPGCVCMGTKRCTCRGQPDRRATWRCWAPARSFSGGIHVLGRVTTDTIMTPGLRRLFPMFITKCVCV